jgi:hypothetical protein
MRDRRDDIPTGEIAGYYWAEDWRAALTLSQMVSELRAHIIGLQAICSTWDTGLEPTDAELPGWSRLDGQPVSPVVDATLANAWPQSACGWDEWYWFRHLPASAGLKSFCDWTDTSLAEANELTQFASPLDLAAQLTRCAPEVVIGDGSRLFILSRAEDVVRAFVEACRRRRTSGCS